MKKTATILVLFIYFIFSAGATVHLHYCMGEFVNLSLSNTNTGECGKCGMTQHGEDNNCCKDVSITAKISDAHIIAYANATFEIPAEELAPDFPSVNENISTVTIVQIRPGAPPGDLTRPLFIQHRRIRI